MLAHDPWHASRVQDSTVDVEKGPRIVGTRAISPLDSKIEGLRELLVGESQRQSDARSSSQASWDSVFGDHHFDLYSWERAAGKARSKVWYVTCGPCGRFTDPPAALPIPLDQVQSTGVWRLPSGAIHLPNLASGRSAAPQCTITAYPHDDSTSKMPPTRFPAASASRDWESFR